MSRIGKKPIVVPAGVEVKLEKNLVTVKGPKGQLETTISENIIVKQENNELIVTKAVDNKVTRGLYGLTRTLINNMVEGVVNEFTKTLEINGVGYKVQKQGENLLLSLGYSHPVKFDAPKGITFDVPDA